MKITVHKTGENGDRFIFSAGAAVRELPHSTRLQLAVNLFKEKRIMRNLKTSIALSLIAVLTISTGCGTGIVINLPNPDDAQYTIRNVQVTGPAQAPGSYNISYEVLITTDGGGASPVVSLVDEDDTLRFGDDLLSQAQVIAVAPQAARGGHPQTAVLSLDCSQVFTCGRKPCHALQRRRTAELLLLPDGRRRHLRAGVESRRLRLGAVGRHHRRSLPVAG